MNEKTDIRGRRGRIQVEIGTELRRFYFQEGKRLNRRPNDLVREALLRDYRQTTGPGQPASRDPRERFLAAVRASFAVWTAAQYAGVSAEDVRAWLQDEDFRREVNQCQELFVEGVEHHLLDMARGRAKGCFGSTIGFLNAHHPNYGRIKGEFLARFIAPMLNRFQRILAEQVGEANAHRAFLEFQAEADARLAQLTV